MIDLHLARAFDEATVILLRATSPVDVLERADDEERAGRPAYNRPGGLAWGDRVCACFGCRTRFVTPINVHAHKRIYCSLKCSNRAAKRAYDARHGWSSVSKSHALRVAAVLARSAA